MVTLLLGYCPNTVPIVLSREVPCEPILYWQSSFILSMWGGSSAGYLGPWGVYCGYTQFDVKTITLGKKTYCFKMLYYNSVH